jgi:pyruvate oxidase/acetolactate synthase-1/2/3 large subunit
MAKYKCTVCDYVLDEEKEGVKFSELPDDFVCPDCGVGKEMFVLLKE